MNKNIFKNKFGLIMLGFFLATICVELLLQVYVIVYSEILKQLYKSTNETKIRYRILAIGESTTTGLWTEKDSYPLQLKQLINKKLKCSCADVQILGSPGGSTNGLLSVLPKKLLEYKPQIVLIMVGVNDEHYFFNNIDAIMLEKWWKEKKLPLIFLYKTIIIPLSHLKIVKTTKYIYSNYFITKNMFEDSLEIKNYPQFGSQDRQNFYYKNRIIIDNLTNDNMKKMINIILQNNSKPVMLTYHAARTNILIKEVANNLSVPLIDNETVFKKLSFKNYVLSKDNWHPNASGYHIIAENVFNYLISSKMIENSNEYTSNQ